MPAAIQTVTGTTTPEALGPTLMHEHLLIGYPGWQADTRFESASQADQVAVCVDRIEEIKELGYRALVDPCPNDLGRDIRRNSPNARRACSASR